MKNDPTSVRNVGSTNPLPPQQAGYRVAKTDGWTELKAGSLQDECGGGQENKGNEDLTSKGLRG